MAVSVKHHLYLHSVFSQFCKSLAWDYDTTPIRDIPLSTSQMQRYDLINILFFFFSLHTSKELYFLNSNTPGWVYAEFHGASLVPWSPIRQNCDEVRSGSSPRGYMNFLWKELQQVEDINMSVFQQISQLRYGQGMFPRVRTVKTVKPRLQVQAISQNQGNFYCLILAGVWFQSINFS